MKLALERHAYAPELNRAHVIRHGRTVAKLPAPGCATIREARAALFQPLQPRRYVRATGERAAPWSGFDRSAAAAYPLAPGVMLRIVADARKALHDVGGVLLDGRVMPPNHVRIETRLTWSK